MCVTRKAHLAALNGDLEALTQLLKSEPRATKAENIFGWTPLHTAAYARHYQIAELLIEAGADINARDKVGRSPLQLLMEIDPSSPVVGLLSKDAPVLYANSRPLKKAATGWSRLADLTKKSTAWLREVWQTKGL